MVKKRTRLSKKDIMVQKRKPWTAKEDAAIRGLVQENGLKQWTLIAENLQKKFNIAGRSGKQCRERWHNHLNVGILKNAWSLSEEYSLFLTHQKIGNKWAEISKEIPGRTDNTIKNHFYSTARKFYRKIFGKEGNGEEIRIHLKRIVEVVIEELNEVRLENGENVTVGSMEDQDIFPDLSDMVIRGHGVKIFNDWPGLDFAFESEQEVYFYPFSPIDNYNTEYIQL